PHHENEIAQSESFTGKPFASYWMHNGMLQLTGEKMSKSLGNLITIEDFLNDHGSDVLRYMVLNSTYRSPLSFNDEVIGQAKKGLERLTNGLRPAFDGAAGAPEDALENLKSQTENTKEKFIVLMDDDFNTASALGVLHRVTRNLNKVLGEVKKDGKNKLSSTLVEEAVQTFTTAGNVLGLFMVDPDDYFGKKQEEGMKSVTISEEEILKRIEERRIAREENDWKKSDQIREELSNQGILLKDTPQGTTWKVK
ncbi:MAG: class I tRNA ligase family protein, partial [Deltaproteobacteria bacterium]|nr:class I tRNA ligase family protein [Deltaproteobacteria bacterium]